MDKRPRFLAVELREWKIERAWMWRRASGGETETDELLEARILTCLSFSAE